MLFPTKLPEGDPWIVAFGLPSELDWYSFSARGGFDLPWGVGLKWPKKFDWSGIGTPVEGMNRGSVLPLDLDGERWFFHLWVQRIGDPREELYLEARWSPSDGRNLVALHGLESSPSDALVSSVVRARDWFLPERAGGHLGDTGVDTGA